ncbi:MAG: hypothetical protein IT379_05505, partial [Deltaproteobacteria bacterium]|nr:hypothetical protein [Deltaproteobacteria bacterium]
DPPRDEPQRDRRALLGDLIVGAFFAHESRRARQRELVARLRAFEQASTMGSSVAHAALASWQREIRDAVPVHHWPLAFPCDADRGLDGLMHAFVGNPPFVDGKRVSSVLGHRYSDWITTVHACRKTADLSGHFVRRCFELLRASATLGMIATNSVSEGETRRVGLAHVVAHGGVLYDATRSMPWPGDAAVHVALLHCARGAAAAHTGAPVLDGREVERIRTSLTAGAERAEPKRLSSNVALSFHGYKPYGDGFQIGAAERDELVRRDPRNAERLRPYAGGTELNRNPELTTDRWVIHFGDLSLDEARRWPDLLRILEERVRPARSSADDGTDDGRRLRTFWWQFFRERPEMQRALRGFDTCLALARVSKHVVVQTPPADWVLDEDVIVFALSGWSPFAVLQSRFHETWARAHSSTFGEGLRYSSSRVFDTFPFPEPDPRATSPALEPLGRDLHEMRLSYQRAARAGATTTYNRMHDPACDDARIAALREAHEALDRGVARAYGLDCVVPPFRACDAASRAAARAFTERVLDHLHALNAERSGAR